MNFYADSPTRYQWLGEVSLAGLHLLDGDLNGRVLVEAPQQFEANETAYALLVSISHDSLDANITDDAATTSFTVDLPVAVAGANQQAYTNQTVILSGSGSDAPARAAGPLYAWTIIDKPDSSQAVLASPSADLTTLNLDKPGVYLVELVVSDGIYSSEPSFVSVTAIAPAEISASTDRLDFANVAPGAVWEQLLQVSNVGGESLTGTATTSGAFEVVSGQNYSLSPGASSTVRVRFTAGAEGAESGILHLSGGGGASIPLTADIAVPAGYGLWADQFGLVGELAAPEFVSGGDGLTNYLKWKLGISPVDPLDGVGLSILGKSAGDVRLRIGKVRAGSTYILQRDLDFSGSWSDLQSLTFEADATNVSILDPNSAGRGAYRLLFKETIGNSSGAAVPVTRKVGIQPVALAGANTGTPVALPFVNNPLFSGTVGTVSGSGISPVSGFGTPNVFTSAHLVLMRSGAEEGLTLSVSSNTGSTIHINGAIPVTIVAGDHFEIVPLNTLNSLFGGVSSGGPAQLAGSTTASGADIVAIGSNRYFYKRAGVNAPGWKLESSPNAIGDQGFTRISDLGGVTVFRKSGVLTLHVFGVLRENKAVLRVSTGSSLLSMPSPQAVSLLDSGLHLALQGGATAGTADKVVIRGLRYFYKNSGTGSPGWRLESSPDAPIPSANQIEVNADGGAFGVVRNGTPISIVISGLYSK